jgi:transglutaminase-like putative cysteine protease
MEQEEIEEQKPWWTPLRIILALILLLLVVLMAVPYYGIKLDPNPEKIPSIDDVIPQNLEPDEKIDVANKNDFYRLVDGNDQEIKMIADSIATYGCGSNKICQAKAIYYFVRNEITYVSDPKYEYVKGAKESLITKGGDCDDHAVLLANLMEAIGIRTEFVFVPNHVYNRIYLPEAREGYKIKGTNWIELDATCKICDFGEVPATLV